MSFIGYLRDWESGEQGHQRIPSSTAQLHVADAVRITCHDAAALLLHHA